MATPKNPVPVKQRTSRADVEMALRTAAQMETPGVSSEEGSAKNSKRIGRPPLVEGRTERITVFLTTKNKKRFKRALLQEQLVRDEKGVPIDQSLLVEEALEAWMNAHGY